MSGNKKITSFEEIGLRISGMRITEVYEIKSLGGKAEISLYYVRYDNHEDKLDLIKRAECEAGVITDLLDSCNILRWDGFCGKNPIGVRDGYMFSFSASVNGGVTVRASGSNNYPSHYRAFRDAVIALLNE